MHDHVDALGTGPAPIDSTVPAKSLPSTTGKRCSIIPAYAEAARAAPANPDPWLGFCEYVEQICAMQAGDRGFTTVLTMTFPTAKRFEADRDRAFHDMRTLVERAKAAGKLRADFVTEDMPMFLMANAGVLTATADAAPDTWRRLVGYLIQACATQAAQPLPDPPAPRQMYKAMLRATGHQRERSRTKER